MKKNLLNNETIQGRLYQHDLVKKKVQNKESKNYGVDFISGTLDIATDEEGLNIISVHYTFKTEITSNGKKDVTYGVLDNIINSGKTWVTDGKDEAMKLRLTPSIAINDFIAADGTAVAQIRNEGGFVNILRGELPEKEDERNTFDCDMLITGVFPVDETEDTPAFVRVKGAVFNFRGDLLPVEFVCKNVLTDYFLGLDASPKNPVFTRVKGNIYNSTVVRKIEEEGAFGLVSVRTVNRTVKEYVITWTIPIAYDFGEEDTMTAEELKKAIQNREVYLADVKKRHDDYVATRDSAPKASDTVKVVAENFDF